MKKVWGEAYRVSTVCIDSYENSVPQGRLYNPHLAEGRVFSSLVQFLTEMEALLEDMNFPQSFTVARDFGAPVQKSAKFAPGAEELLQGKLATFNIRIMFRQNSSWQGSVTWQETNQEQVFRSVLELIFILDGALKKSAQV